MLNETQVNEVWELLNGTQLAPRLPYFRSELAEAFDVVVLNEGAIVFDVGDELHYLYLVSEGTIHQVVSHENQVWLERKHIRGDVLGQEAFVIGKHGSRAVTQTPAVLYVMQASEIAVALERDAELFEGLLNQATVRRLRGIPLLRSLSDLELWYLAQVTEASELSSGAALEIAGESRLWLVDWGQVQLVDSGSDAPHRISTGSYFVIGEAFGDVSVCAHNVLAARQTRLISVNAGIGTRLMSVFADIRNMIEAPVDLSKTMAGVQIFGDLGKAQLQQLAEFAVWQHVPRRQTVPTHSYRSGSILIVWSGTALVFTTDELGQRHPLRPLARGDWCSEACETKLHPSVLENSAQGIRVMADPNEMAGTDVILLDRHDLETAFVERPDLWPPKEQLVQAVSGSGKDIYASYDWLDEGEKILWYGRQHLVSFLFPLLCALPIGLIALLLAGSLTPSGVRPIVLGLLAIGIGAALILFIRRKLDRYSAKSYMLTDRRLVASDQLDTGKVARKQINLDAIIDVSVFASFWGRLFDYGDLRARTADHSEELTLKQTPLPEVVKAELLEARRSFLTHAELRGINTEQPGTRNKIPQELQASHPQPPLGAGIRLSGQMLVRWVTWQVSVWRARRSQEPDSLALRPKSGQKAVIDGTQEKTQVSPDSRLGQDGNSQPKQPSSIQSALPTPIHFRILDHLPPRLRYALLGNPASRPRSGKIETISWLWRKHPIVLVSAAWMPSLVTAGLLAALITLGDLAAILGLSLSIIVLTWTALFTASAGWLWWRFAEYRGDLYVVTRDRIRDIEMKPLRLSYRFREGNLSRVTTVSVVQRGFLANLLNYGSVIMRTTAVDEGFDFVVVPNPRNVQKRILLQLQALHARAEMSREPTP